TPVNAIANSTGKKIIKTGVRIVPRPKPEKKVRIATANAANDITTISIYGFALFSSCYAVLSWKSIAISKWGFNSVQLFREELIHLDDTIYIHSISRKPFYITKMVTSRF